MQARMINGARIVIAKDYNEMSRLAAARILKAVKRNPALSILVPTGTTPEGVYAILRKHRNLFSQATFWNMDEYCKGKRLISRKHPASYRNYMHDRLFRQVKAKSYFPAVRNIRHPGTYDALIRKQGGIDLCLDAIGEDCHTFGFNFPGSSFRSRTRLVRINKGTKEVNQQLTGIETPAFAVTTGLGTGMLAREVIVIVSGKRKAGILRKVLFSPVSEKIPATILREHSNCTWIADKEAARLLR
ncbi:MAG TPA: glucosamine-6-phosphate deaminase [Candidatus Nanoarchaeia archaeon]|nr:glucosamine-6-phosphate deaminase [Candidatus Nanoarchaeia archaeon]